MKKGIACLLILALLCSGLTGCMVNRTEFYANADKYSVGDAEIAKTVNHIEIAWVGGSVTVQTHAEASVTVTETDGGSRPEDLQVHWWLDGDVLRLHFCASGTVLGPGQSQKDLLVQVPETLVLSSLRIDSASAKISAEISALEIDLDSASGPVSLTQHGTAEKIEIDTASGRVDAVLDAVKTLDLDTASGALKAEVRAVDRLNVDSASGAIDLSLGSLPQTCDVDSASGAVTLRLPENAEFRLEFGTASGRLHSDFPLTGEGKSYLCGAGAVTLKVDTASGSLTLKKSVNQ